MNLLLKPSQKWGLIHEVDPQTAKWLYVGFSLFKLKIGDTVSQHTATDEVILVIVEGKISIKVGSENFGVLGDRLNVFDKKPPHSVYVSPGTEFFCKAKSEATLAVCKAPGKGHHQSKVLELPELSSRGQENNKRFIHNIAMEDDDVADSLLVTEVFTPQGNWSSYPPHRHDEDDFPRITYLEETYYHRINPSKGYGTQRIWTEDGELDETYTISNDDVVLVPKGHHPCGVAYGYEMYYLNVMAGPIRKWRFKNHPDYEWLLKRDQK